MKKIGRNGLVALVAVVLLGLASVAGAQLNLGAVIQVDNDRIESAPGVSFGAAVYSADPPEEGFDSPDLIGLFSSALGQYPVLYRGLWLKLTVFPGGFRRLEGVDFDPSGRLSKDEKRGWEPLLSEEGGGFSTAFRAQRLGAVPLRFRVRHRDGRDRYSLLIFTVSWVKGGTLPTAMEIMVQREPNGRLVGEEALPYLRGFLPATATRSDAGVTQQKIEVPAQTASQTVTSGSQGNRPRPVEPDDSPTEYNSVGLSIWQSPLPSGEIADRQGLTRKGHELAEMASRRGSQGTNATSVELDSTKWRSFALVLEDGKSFTAELLPKGRSQPIRLVVKRQGSKYRAVGYGSVTSLIDAVLNVTDSQGNLWTVTFTDRPEGQGEER